MKQANDVYTRDLIDKPKRGRPRKADALTPAQRAKAYRARLRENPGLAAQAATQRANLAWIKARASITRPGGAFFTPDTPFPGRGP